MTFAETGVPETFRWHSEGVLGPKCEGGPEISTSEDQAAVVWIFHLLVFGVMNVEG